MNDLAQKKKRIELMWIDLEMKAGSKTTKFSLEFILNPGDITPFLKQIRYGEYHNIQMFAEVPLDE